MMDVKGSYTHYDLPRFIHTLPDFLGKIPLSDKMKQQVKATRNRGNESIMAGAFKECVAVAEDFCAGYVYLSEYTEEEITSVTMVLCVLLNEGFYCTHKDTKFEDIRSLLAFVGGCLLHKSIVDDIATTPVVSNPADDVSGFPDDLVTILHSDILKEEAKRLLYAIPKGMPLDYGYLIAGVEGHCERSQSLSDLDTDKMKQLATYLCYLLTGKDGRTELVTVTRHCNELVIYIDKCLSKASCYGMSDTLQDECQRPTIYVTDEVINHLSKIVITTDKGQVKFTKKGLDKLHVLLNKEDLLTYHR